MFDRKVVNRYPNAVLRRDGRVVEGAPLLREYRLKKLIEGSNPSLSAIDAGYSTVGQSFRVFYTLL